MPNKIIFFKETKPTEEDIRQSIRGFCNDHSMRYRKIGNKQELLYQIDEMIYDIKICKDIQNTCWMIQCVSH